MNESYSNTVKSARLQAARLIEAVLNGTMTSADAVRTIESAPPIEDQLLDEIFHALIHYREDEDLRRQSAAYAERQQRALRGLLARCR